jgi:ribosomal protein S27E
MKKEKEKTQKGCDHSATYFDRSVDDFICQYCHKVVGELRMGKSKKNTVDISKIGKKK